MKQLVFVIIERRLPYDGPKCTNGKTNRKDEGNDVKQGTTCVERTSFFIK